MSRTFTCFYEGVNDACNALPAPKISDEALEDVIEALESPNPAVFQIWLEAVFPALGNFVKARIIAVDAVGGILGQSVADLAPCEYRNNCHDMCPRSWLLGVPRVTLVRDFDSSFRFDSSAPALFDKSPASVGYELPWLNYYTAWMEPDEEFELDPGENFEEDLDGYVVVFRGGPTPVDVTASGPAPYAEPSWVSFFRCFASRWFSLWEVQPDPRTMLAHFLDHINDNALYPLLSVVCNDILQDGRKNMLPPVRDTGLWRPCSGPQ